MSVSLGIRDLKLIIKLINKNNNNDECNNNHSTLLTKLKLELTSQMALRNAAISSYKSAIKRGVE
ncbi:TPA: hypothetical protein ACS72N_001731 [Providencia alcalifaciens]